MNLNCPICRRTKFNIYTYHGLIQCDKCGIIVNRHISQEGADWNINKDWFEQVIVEPSFWERIFEAFNNKRTLKRIHRYKSSGLCLEIGVGSGSLLYFMRNKGFKVEGHDLSKLICNYVENKHSIKMYSSLFDIPVDKQYDVIIMNHVLEHVSIPILLLEKIRNHMKNDSILHLAVPNISSWNARFPGWQVYEPYHMIYFNPQTIKKTLEKSGQFTVNLETDVSFSSWFLTILRTLLKSYKNNFRCRSEMGKYKKTWFEHIYRILMIGFGIITLPLKYIQESFGYGDEIIIIVKSLYK